jgi:hypothetical protein
MSDDWFGRWPSRIHSGAHLIHGELLKLGFEILSGQFLGWCAQHDSTCDLLVRSEWRCLASWVLRGCRSDRNPLIPGVRDKLFTDCSLS